MRYAGDLELSQADLLVIPELSAYRVPEIAPGIPKVIFNQNHFNTFRGMTSNSADVYHHDDVKGVVVVSEESASFFRFAFPDVHVERLRYGIDSHLYHPQDPKSRAVVYMPRKRANEVADVLALLQLHGALDRWQLLAIDGVDEASAAAILRRSQVFLCFSYREGFGLPPAEAMAAGCVVVGFDGFGGHELFRDHGIAISEGDVVAFARAVEGLLADWDSRVAVFKDMAKRVVANSSATLTPSTTKLRMQSESSVHSIRSNINEPQVRSGCLFRHHGLNQADGDVRDRT